MLGEKSKRVLFSLEVPSVPGATQVPLFYSVSALKQLFKGKSREERTKLCRSIWTHFEMFKEIVNEYLREDLDALEDETDGF